MVVERGPSANHLDRASRGKVCRHGRGCSGFAGFPNGHRHSERIVANLMHPSYALGSDTFYAHDNNVKSRSPMMFIRPQSRFLPDSDETVRTRRHCLCNNHRRFCFFVSIYSRPQKTGTLAIFDSFNPKDWQNNLLLRYYGNCYVRSGIRHKHPARRLAELPASAKIDYFCIFGNIGCCKFSGND